MFGIYCSVIILVAGQVFIISVLIKNRIKFTIVQGYVLEYNGCCPWTNAVKSLIVDNLP